MSRLVIQHRELEAQIKSLQTELANIEQNPAYPRELDFAEKLDGLMTEYRKSLTDIIHILDPESFIMERPRTNRGPAPGTARTRNRYKNPHTGEIVETASGNHKVLKSWRNDYPNDNIKEWIVGEEE